MDSFLEKIAISMIVLFLKKTNALIHSIKKL